MQPRPPLFAALWPPQEIFAKSGEAGDILVDRDGPYAAALGDVEADVFSTFGRFPITAE